MAVEQLGGGSLDRVRHEASFIVGIVIRLVHGRDQPMQIGRHRSDAVREPRYEPFADAPRMDWPA